MSEHHIIVESYENSINSLRDNFWNWVVVIIALIFIVMFVSAFISVGYEHYFKKNESNQVINYTAFCVYACDNLEKLYGENSPNKLGNPPYDYNGHFFEEDKIVCVCGENNYKALIKEVEETYLK